MKLRFLLIVSLLASTSFSAIADSSTPFTGIKKRPMVVAQIEEPADVGSIDVLADISDENDVIVDLLADASDKSDLVIDVLADSSDESDVVVDILADASADDEIDNQYIG